MTIFLEDLLICFIDRGVGRMLHDVSRYTANGNFMSFLEYRPFALSLSKGSRSWFDRPVLSLPKGSPRTVSKRNL
jgi:hypothetical protein